MQASIKDLEKERSNLKVRATIAEEQLKTLQKNYDKSTYNYQKKISELTSKKIT